MSEHTTDKPDRDAMRDVVLRSYEARLGSAAHYTGETWERAVEEVLDIMERDGLLPVDAISRYRAAHRSRINQSVKHVERFKVRGFRIPKVVMDTALDLADGDISRLRVSKDGSVTVVNKSRRPE